MITDGNPYPLREQNPCDSTAEAEALRADLELYDIKVIIIGVGSNLNTSILSCLVDDEAVDIIEVSSFDSFDSIRNQIDSQILAANAPSNVNLIETTQTHIVDESVFSIAPDSITTLPGGQTQMTWNDIAQHVGNSDNKLSIDESFSVSFNAKSNLAGVDLEVNDLAESSVSFIDHNGVATSVGLPQALITVLIDTDGDTILDHLDNCPFDANLDQADLDGDLIGDACDADDDNDGVLDSNDIDPFDPNVCQDSDNDTCDDCSIGSDGLGPLVDFDIANDGPDFDSDTVCDAGDPDVDGDNILGATDCNDLDPTIGGPITWYADTDGDSFGDPNNSQLACEIPDHFVPIAGDCLDTDFGVKPGATEVLDGLDNDCDGATDEGFTDPDNDFVDSSDDNCPDDANADQLNTDGDEAGDACDVCPADIDNDSDGDGLCLDVDVCPLDPFNDADNDGVCGDVDACPDEFGDGTDGCTIIPPTPVPTSTDHYLAYDVKETKHTDKFEKMTLTLTDQFETDAVYKVEKPHHLYNPVDKNGEGISDEISHMVGYKIKEPKGDPKFEKVTDVLVQNQFGDIIVDVKKPKLLLVPSAKDHFTVPDELNPITINHFKCYDVKESKDTPKFVKRTVTVNDPNFEITKDFEIKKPKQLCTPVDKNGEGIVDVENYLMCYDLKKMKGEPKFEKRNVFTNNQFGHDDLEVKKQHQLCVPSKILP